MNQLFKASFTIVILGLIGLLNGCVAHPVSTQTSVHVRDDNLRMHLIFSDYDRNYIYKYYGYPNKRRYKKIPPGHYKRLERHRPLPSSYHYRPLPWELERRLSPLPAGYIRVIVGNDIAIMNTRTRVLYDILWEIQ